MGKTWAALFFTANLIFASTAGAQCSVATVTVNGRVENVPRNAHVHVQLVYPKKEHEESVDARPAEDVFRIPVEFLTESRRGWLNNLGEKCGRKPKTVVVTLWSGNEEGDSVSLDFFRDFQQSDPSNYTVKREVVLRGQQH